MILSAPYLLLSRADFEQPADPLRALNVTGRWAIQASVQSPLLAWLPSQAEAASAAAARASEARACAVVVVSQSDTRVGEGSATAVFTEAFESALTGPTPHSAAKTRRLRTETDKLEAFCRVVRAASAAADQPAFAAVGRAASKALRAKSAADRSLRPLLGWPGLLAARRWRASSPARWNWTARCPSGKWSRR